MKRCLMFLLALAVAPAPVFAQPAPSPGGGSAGRSPQAFAAMQQSHMQLQQLRQQARARLLSALTPAHRTLLANLVGQLALSVNPDVHAAATELDTVLTPAEKQSVVSIDTADRTSARAIMRQARAAVEASASAEQRAAMVERQARMQAFEQGRARTFAAADPGLIVLRMLGNLGGRGFDHGGPPRDGA